jgi:hypothetical protein
VVVRKLAALGYQVWSDVTKPLGDEDFWSDIEPIIRDLLLQGGQWHSADN